MSDLRETKPDALFLGDNGECLCGEHLGAAARFTGCDISGQPILEVTPDIVAEAPDTPWACEACGKRPSRLWRA